MATAKKKSTKKAPAKKAAAKKAPAKKAPAKKAQVKKAAAKKGPAKKAAAKKAPAKKAPAKKAPAKKASARKAAAKKAPAKKAPAKKAPAKKAPAKKAVAKKPPAKKAVVKQAPAKKAATKVAPVTTVPAKKAGSSASVPTTKKAATKTATKRPAPIVLPLPPVKGVTKEGVAYTKDFDAKFVVARWHHLQAEKTALIGQAVRLEDEANQLIEQHEMGDVQFDDEGGEGDTIVVERERDIVLSMQARQTIADIDDALARLTKGSYGYSIQSGRPIPRERLEAIPWATVLVEEKVGGLGRR